MKKRDAASGGFWLLVGAFVAWSGWDLELGSIHDPGSGFILFWVGLIMAALSAGVVIGAFGGGVELPAWAGTRWPKVVFVLLALVAYAWLLPRAGFIVTTTVVLVFLFKVVEPQRWWVAVGGAVASALLAYLVFRVWLGAQLPAGMLGIG